MTEETQFTFEGSLSYTIRFPLINDTIGLEDIENYTLILENPRPSQIVELGSTKINIVDDDGMYLFDVEMYNGKWNLLLIFVELLHLF